MHPCKPQIQNIELIFISNTVVVDHCFHLLPPSGTTCSFNLRTDSYLHLELVESDGQSAAPDKGLRRSERWGRARKQRLR